VSKVEEKQFKICTKCKVELPATEEFFEVRKDRECRLRAECRKCRKEYFERYRAEHKSEVRERNRNRECNNSAIRQKYYQENKEQIKQYYQDNIERRKKYKIENAERIAEQRKEYNARSAERITENRRRYRSENREYFAVVSQNRRAAKGSLISDFTVDQWAECLDYFDNQDAYTGLEMKVPSQDHVVPLSKGGHYTVDNIVPCERRINSSKGNQDMIAWFRKQSFYDVEREEKILRYIELVSKG